MSLDDRAGDGFNILSGLGSVEDGDHPLPSWLAISTLFSAVPQIGLERFSKSLEYSAKQADKTRNRGLKRKAAFKLNLRLHAPFRAESPR